MKRLWVLLLPPGWDASPAQGYLQHYIRWYPFIHLGGERHRESRHHYRYISRSPKNRVSSLANQPVLNISSNSSHRPPLPNQTSHLIVQSCSLLYPEASSPILYFSRRISYSLLTILIAEKTLTQRAIKTFNDSLIAVITSTFPVLILTSCSAISFLTSPMNSRPVTSQKIPFLNV